MGDSHVVFGATGALGSAIVRRLAADRTPVRAVVRDAEAARQLLPASAGIFVADALNRNSVLAACRGAGVIYHCVNVRHSRWSAQLPLITENILAAAKETKARLLFPGNAYGYGPLRTVPAAEDHPLLATSKKGRLRIALEDELMDAHSRGEIRLVIPRFPDLYGPYVTNPLMAPIFEAALAGRVATWPSDLDVPHSLLYIDDAAAACVLLAATDSAYGQVWHVPGPGPLTGRQFLEAVFRAADAEPKTKALSRTLFRLFGIFIPDAGEMVELLYQFEQPLVLDGSKFALAFPSFSYTPHDDAIRRTVEWFREQSSR